MRWVDRGRLWMFENWFHKRARRLQEEQVKEHKQVLDEMRVRRRGILHDLADEVFRLEAVTESLERSLSDMSEDE